MPAAGSSLLPIKQYQSTDDDADHDDDDDVDKFLLR